MNAKLNKAMTRTLNRIKRGGPEGVALNNLDRRHLGYLDRRGLVHLVGSPCDETGRAVACEA